MGKEVRVKCKGREKWRASPRRKFPTVHWRGSDRECERGWGNRQWNWMRNGRSFWRRVCKGRNNSSSSRTTRRGEWGRESLRTFLRAKNYYFFTTTTTSSTFSWSSASFTSHWTTHSHLYVFIHHLPLHSSTASLWLLSSAHSFFAANLVQQGRNEPPPYLFPLVNSEKWRNDVPSFSRQASQDQGSATGKARMK